MTRRLAGLIAVLWFSLLGHTALAGSWVEMSTPAQRSQADVIKDDTIIMRSDTAFKELRVTNPDIADVAVLTNKSFQLFGKRGGKTKVILYGDKSHLLDVIDVNVGFDIENLRQSLKETFPSEDVKIRKMAGGLYLKGHVSTEVVSQQIMTIAQAYAPDQVTNGLTVYDSHQVMLEVRFVEASRDTVKELGLGMLVQRAGDFAFQTGAGLVSGGAPALAGGFATNIDSVSVETNIQALEEKGVVRTLAEPTLVAMSGDTASFLAGGEFPIPVSADNGQIAIEFRQFGVGLAFTPTVLDDGVINLKVAPEVSQIDTSNSVRISGIEVPSLRVRRAQTTVELRNSQSFAIAGLLQNDSTNSKVQVPWAGDIPILGTLFSSTRYQNAETELVILVTPRLVKPVSDISQLSTPLEHMVRPDEFEAFFGGKADGEIGDTSANEQRDDESQPAEISSELMAKVDELVEAQYSLE